MRFYLSEKLPACVRYPFPRGVAGGSRQQVTVCPRCCPSVPLANTRGQEIRRQVKVVLRAHRLISLIALFLNGYLSIRLEPGSKRRFPASLMFLPLTWFKGLFLEVLKLMGDKAEH